MAGSGPESAVVQIDAKLCRMKMDAALTAGLAPFALGRKKGKIFQRLDLKV
jgi:hypothetical protein